MKGQYYLSLINHPPTYQDNQNHPPLHKKSKIRYSYYMNTKPLTLLLIFLFLLSGNGFVYGQEPEVKKGYWESGKLKSETHYKNGQFVDPLTTWYENGNEL